ncbi:hypothetical protein PBY51_009197 [Eleginops maclovinus]|uniref:Uncharacterized protein n=1 Tax=Eleginops maclovinus TaxID=56733 RepID=A0AAN7XQW7_ELEMC|nr:hypothetical protein PBY51_009197 [Eleginops maclovinus]
MKAGGVSNEVKVKALEFDQKVLLRNSEKLNRKYEKLLKSHKAEMAALRKEIQQQVKEPSVEEAEIAALRRENQGLK